MIPPSIIPPACFYFHFCMSKLRLILLWKKKKKKTYPVRERLHMRLQVLPAAVCRWVLLIARHYCIETSPLGSLYSWNTSIQGTQNLVPEKNFHIIFECVTAIEGTPLFRGEEHIFWVPKPGLTSILGTLSTQNMTYHKEGWCILEYTNPTALRACCGGFLKASSLTTSKNVGVEECHLL